MNFNSKQLILCRFGKTECHVCLRFQSTQTINGNYTFIFWGQSFLKFELYYLTAHHCNEIMTKHIMTLRVYLLFSCNKIIFSEAVWCPGGAVAATRSADRDDAGLLDMTL